MADKWTALSDGREGYALPTHPERWEKQLRQGAPCSQDLSWPGQDNPGKPPWEDSSQVVLPVKGRRWGALVVLLGFLAATAAVLGAVGYELGWLHRQEGRELQQAIGRIQQWAAGLACLGAVGFLGAAWWLFRLGWQINRTGQYPPPGMQVLWKTRIRTGPTALLWANFAYLLAVLLAAGGTLGMIWLYQQAAESLRTLLPNQ